MTPRSHRRWAGHEEGVGSFSYAVTADTWQWSDAVYAIHGFHRGDVVPTKDLLLAHADVGDRPHVAESINACLRDAHPFSFLYRLIDASGHRRWVVIIAEGTSGHGSGITGLRGYLTDLTEPQARARSRQVAATLRQAVASRAIIEQAKGALMVAYGLDAEAAFALLNWESQRENVKLREVARRLVTAVAAEVAAPATALRERLGAVTYRLTAAMAAGPPARVPARTVAGLTGDEQRTGGGAVVLSLRGDLDTASAPRLDHYLTQAVGAAAPPAPVVVDLSGVRHLGPAGVALLLSHQRRCQLAGLPLRVAVSGPMAESLTTVLGRPAVYRRVPDALAVPAAPEQSPQPLRRGRHRPHVVVQWPDPPPPRLLTSCPRWMRARSTREPIPSLR